MLLVVTFWATPFGFWRIKVQIEGALLRKSPKHPMFRIEYPPCVIVPTAPLPRVEEIPQQANHVLYQQRRWRRDGHYFQSLFKIMFHSYCSPATALLDTHS